MVTRCATTPAVFGESRSHGLVLDEVGQEEQ